MADWHTYKTEVACSIGLSIQSPDGSWEKSNISITTESGPGYPTEAQMAQLMQQQMADATKGANEQIEMIAAKILEKVQHG
jgi:hypothetical protein